MDNIYVLIMAAGSGLRFNSDIPKQYSLLGEIAIIRHTILTFLELFKADRIRAIIKAEDLPLYNDATKGLGLLEPVIGGSERHISVKRGLDSLRKLNPSKVLIQDAVRPFVSLPLITRVVEELKVHDGVIPVLPVRDTTKRLASTKFIEATLDRNALGLAQTPQAFDFKEICQAYEENLSPATDDSQIFENTGRKVKTVAGEEINFKITTQDDLMRGELIMNMSYDTYIGSGFDAHRFKSHQANKNYIMLCGVQIACDMGLEAHSDGDVAIHALVDALLGCIGGGDIGMHFPPSELKWKNADSRIFLEKAVTMVKEKNGQIVNVDLTIIGEKPRIGKYRSLMQENIATILSIAKDRVNIKATTTEKMGFTGREEGIAAQAVASVKISRTLLTK